MDNQKITELSPNAFQMFIDYAHVLTLLYGICTMKLFMEIYNRDASPKNRIEDKKTFRSLMQKAAREDKRFYYRRSMIVSDGIDFDIQAENLFADRTHLKPYIPSKKEIAERSKNIDYDENIPEINGFLACLAKCTDTPLEAFGAVVNLIPYIKLGYPVDQIIEILNEDSGIIFENIDEANEFFTFYTAFHNACHLWTNWGHSPNELSEKKRGKEKTDVFTPEFLEAEKEHRTHRSHIELSAHCSVPSSEEIVHKKNELDIYTDDRGKRPPKWHITGDAVIKRIKPMMQKFGKIFNELPESEHMIGRLSDQWLASVYHSKVIQSINAGEFSGKEWNYHVFEPVEKIGDDIFTCLDTEGDPFILYSPAVGRCMEDGAISCVTVLIDAGGYFFAYGPVLFWAGLTVRDIHTLAKHTAPDLYKQKGFSAVMHFNPCPLWAAIAYSGMPPVYRRGKLIETYTVQGKLRDNCTGNLKNSLKDYTYAKKDIYERWVETIEDVLPRDQVYLNSKKGETLLVSCSQEKLDALKKLLSGCIDIVENTEQGASLLTDLAVKQIFKKTSLFEKLERHFEN